MTKNKIYLGADHAGFNFKEKIKSFLISQGYNIDDLGAYELKENDDYPDFAFKVAKIVSKNHGSVGILFCGTGAGMAIAANKVLNIRAVEVYDLFTAKMSKEHNNSNIIAIGCRNLSLPKIKSIVEMWLKTDFSKEKRHIRRLKKIEDFEYKN